MGCISTIHWCPNDSKDYCTSSWSIRFGYGSNIGEVAGIVDADIDPVAAVGSAKGGKGRVHRRFVGDISHRGEDFRGGEFGFEGYYSRGEG